MEGETATSCHWGEGKNKWLRVSFEAARPLSGYPSMNECLHKGPKRFFNNLMAVGLVSYVVDISKFHDKYGHLSRTFCSWTVGE